MMGSVRIKLNPKKVKLKELREHFKHYPGRYDSPRPMYQGFYQVDSNPSVLGVSNLEWAHFAMVVLNSCRVAFVAEVTKSTERQIHKNIWKVAGAIGRDRMAHGEPSMVEIDGVAFGLSGS